MFFLNHRYLYGLLVAISISLAGCANGLSSASLSSFMPGGGVTSGQSEPDVDYSAQKAERDQRKLLEKN